MPTSNEEGPSHTSKLLNAPDPNSMSGHKKSGSIDVPPSARKFDIMTSPRDVRGSGVVSPRNPLPSTGPSVAKRPQDARVMGRPTEIKLTKALSVDVIPLPNHRKTPSNGSSTDASKGGLKSPVSDAAGLKKPIGASNGLPPPYPRKLGKTSKSDIQSETTDPSLSKEETFTRSWGDDETVIHKDDPERESKLSKNIKERKMKGSDVLSIEVVSNAKKSTKNSKLAPAASTRGKLQSAIPATSVYDYLFILLLFSLMLAAAYVYHRTLKW